MAVGVTVDLLGNGGDPIEYIVAHDLAVPKGSLMKLNDNRTVTISAADGDMCAGVAAEEHVATVTGVSVGTTRIVCWTNGIWVFTDAGAGVTVGIPITIGGVNEVKAAAGAEGEGGTLCGQALETLGAAGTGECRIYIGKNY